MSAPYIAACLMACLAVSVFAVWKMGKLNNLKVTAQIAKIFSLSIEATSDSGTRMIDDGDSHHDPRSPKRMLEHEVGSPAWSSGRGTARFRRIVYAQVSACPSSPQPSWRFSSSTCASMASVMALSAPRASCW
jgi:hypothetical protein